ncbi:conserved repeat domain protein [Lancefieldella parvula DSM 20469]|uniref:Conserved repeat domain protein n=1 Tax=Lancefieldella parvula (strain ATCC 33793 / DSM 20469 / CCUG 32760 / JCM 10300 / KCTC 3663 / VPI 0546 / 1246) TaxID=521095 RepID=C8W899_LANP1|nr:Sgo0707 family adhesin [Lancefieldella parvula]ACV51689.1 conserved repeat domain protein [Lancefieldella parvula DSM 20469]
MKKSFLKRISVFLTMIMACLVMFVNTAQAFDRQKDDSDLTQINIYQFTMTRDNMTVLSQGDGVKRVEIPASDTGNLPSTAFVMQPTKDGSNHQYNQPLSLKFSNAGTVDGESVDVYVTVNSLDLTLKNTNADYNNPNKTDVPFLTVDENWGTKSFSLMDYIDVNHPSYTADMLGSYAINANVTMELRYSDGTPCNLKLVMQPSDIDVLNGGTNETFSLVNAESTVDSIVMSNRNVLTETTNGNKITWNPTRPTSGNDQEKNLAGFAVKSKSNSLTFESTSAATSGSLFGAYTEVISPAPVKAVDPEQAPAKAGEEITYTGTFTLPRQGIDTIGKIKSMSMVDTFDERLDYQSLSVSFDGQTLTEGTDYTVSVDGQKVTVDIDAHLLTKENGGKKFVITYKTLTNSKIETDSSNIDNELTQVVDGNIAHSNKVTTELLYEKTHEYVSGTPNKELPQEVLDLLPGKQTRIPNGTTVTPDQPLGGVTRVETSDGTWVFIGYDHDSEIIDHKNAHFIGVWVILPQPKKDVLDSEGNSIDGNKVTAGQVLTYSVTYTNTTNTARDVTVTDVIPEHTTYVDNSADNGGVYDKATRTVTWTKNVAPGETLTVTFQVKVNKGVKDITVVNTAHVSDGLIDTDTNTTKNPVIPKPRKSRVPNTGDNTMRDVIIVAGLGGIALLIVIVLKLRSSRK